MLKGFAEESTGRGDEAGGGACGEPATPAGEHAEPAGAGHLPQWGGSSSSTAGTSRPAASGPSAGAGIEAWEQHRQRFGPNDGTKVRADGVPAHAQGGDRSNGGSSGTADGAPAPGPRAGDAGAVQEEMRRHTRLICDLGRKHLWQQAINAFQEVVQPDMITRSALLAVVAKTALWETTMAQLREIRQVGMEPNVVTYNAAISATRGRGWADAISLLAEMLEHRVTPNGITYTTLVQACELKGEWEHACDLIADMTRAGLTPTVDIYKRVMSMPDRESARDGRWEWSLAMLADMAAKGLRPDEETLRAACVVCERDYRWREALDLLARAILDNTRSRRHCPPDAFYASAMKTCEKCRHWEHALVLFDHLTSRSRQITNLPVYDTALGACALGGRWKEALRVLASMKRSALKPDLDHYNAALCTLETCTKWEQTLALLQEVYVRGFQPSVESYNSAMVACEGADKWAISLKLLGRLRSSGLEPDAVTYNASMHACSKGGKWEFALALLDQAAREGLTVNNHTLDTAIGVCLECDQWEAVWGLVRGAQSSSRQPARSSQG